jgi:lysophospholipase L1-like esterase
MNYIYKLFILFCILNVQFIFSQQIENSESLELFINKLKQNKDVTNILLIGDSHMQAGVLPNVLKNNFQFKYGNAGRGLVFPFQIANSNGPEDFSSVSNQTWQNFRLTYAQDVFEQMGAAGFVIGNNKESFIQIKLLKEEDAFTKVIVFNDTEMIGDTLVSYQSSDDLSDFIKRKKSIKNYSIENGMTYPEIASKFYTTTTRLTQLNGTSIQNPKVGKNVKVEENTIVFNPEFENTLVKNKNSKITSDTTQIYYKNKALNFLIKSKPKQQNLFYGFQFLNNSRNGVVFNTIGVNGATYGDLFKYDLTIDQLKKLKSDLIIISLGTNESLTSISKEEFIANAQKTIQNLRADNKNLPILLLSPTDNNLAAEKVKIIANWVREVSLIEHTAFLDFYELMGGSGYFNKALSLQDARTDKVHFNKSGYEKQADKIWNSLQNILP